MLRNISESEPELFLTVVAVNVRGSTRGEGPPARRMSDEWTIYEGAPETYVMPYRCS